MAPDDEAPVEATKPQSEATAGDFEPGKEGPRTLTDDEAAGVECALPAACGIGDAGPDVYALQAWLTARKWYKGDDTAGEYGWGTARAVQRAQRLGREDDTWRGPVDGKWTDDLRSVMCRYSFT